MNAIEIQGLTKRYGPITAVDGLDLTVRQGELFALLGVNGAGKTTTIKMLSCLTRPDSGDARLLGRSVVTDTAAVKNCICGALLTNLTAWLSGTWFDLELVGGAFQRIAYALPFVHAVELDRAALSGDWASVMPHLWWVLAYAAAALAAAVLLFLRQMKRQ